MVSIKVACIYCESKEIVKNGRSSSGIQRYSCRGENCQKTFQLNYCYRAYQSGIKEQIIDMAMNGSSIRDTARVLKIGINTVLRTLKKSVQLGEN